MSHICRFRPYYELHHLNYSNWLLKICIWQQYFSSWLPEGDLRIFLISSPVAWRCDLDTTIFTKKKLKVLIGCYESDDNNNIYVTQVIYLWFSWFNVGWWPQQWPLAASNTLSSPYLAHPSDHMCLTSPYRPTPALIPLKQPVECLTESLQLLSKGQNINIPSIEQDVIFGLV